MTEANLHQPPSLLAVQHAVNSFAERLRCDKWDAVLPFEVACLHETIGHTVLQRIMVVISDGDSQETSQLDLAIFQYFRHVQRVRCGWHIVEKGVQSHCPGEKSVAPKQKEAYKTLIKLVKNWIYSWMRPGYCESEDEYHISKVLFFEYLSSHTCLSLCGENKEIQRQIIDFVTRFVLPHEDLFVFFRRKHIRHFDEYNNCSHEGTNYGLKSHAAGVLPGHSIDNAGERLTYQAELKYTELAKLAARDFSSREVWSEMPSTEHLCMRAQALIAVDLTSRLKFAVRRSFQAHGSNLCWKLFEKKIVIYMIAHLFQDFSVLEALH